MSQFVCTDNKTKRIICIVFKVSEDAYADLSYLGVYSMSPGKGHIDRKKRGNMQRHQFRYFIPAMTGEETGNPDSPEQDYQRMESYNRGEWHMNYCKAVATVSINGVMQNITSGGIGGVESDSSADYFAEIERDEMQDLRSILENIGFTTEQIDAAMPL